MIIYYRKINLYKNKGTSEKIEICFLSDNKSNLFENI